MLSIPAYLRFREPQLHRAGDRISVGQHLAVVYTTLTTRTQLREIVTLMVLTSLILQLVLEFGPLWLVALGAPALAYGPYWAGLMATLGLGGLLAGRLALDSRTSVGAVATLMILASLALTTSTDLAVVTIAQVVLAALIVVAGIHATRRMHDAVPSTIRSGVASGAGSISWIAFLPIALVFGVVSQARGVHTAGWTLTALTFLTAALLAGPTLRRHGLEVAEAARTGQGR